MEQKLPDLCGEYGGGGWLKILGDFSSSRSYIWIGFHFLYRHFSKSLYYSALKVSILFGLYQYPLGAAQVASKML
jgi:hypothetical protein